MVEQLVSAFNLPQLIWTIWYQCTYTRNFLETRRGQVDVSLEDKPMLSPVPITEPGGYALPATEPMEHFVALPSPFPLQSFVTYQYYVNPIYTPVYVAPPSYYVTWTTLEAKQI